MTAAALPNTYDQVPYPSRPFAETHPDRLAAIGMLFGMDVQPIDNCRVLEIGCARGGNLAPMAEQLPGSQFLGIDLSQGQIAEASDLAVKVGLENVQFLCTDIRDFDARHGEFDYILCHGVFSWVAREVQDKILEICATRLKPLGVAYASYNALPGWRVRDTIRDMMCFHAGGIEDPQARIREARKLVEFLSESTPADSLYGAELRRHAQALRGKEDGYLFHDELEEVNAPIYFAQFAERARAQGLQFLAEADLATMWSRNLPPAVAASLERMTTNLIRREQYLDFVRNRDFRMTLLCRRQVNIDRDLRPERLDRLHAAAPWAPAEPAIDPRDASSMNFRHLPSGRELVATGIWKGSLLCLGEAWPASVPVGDLASRARAAAGLEPITDVEILRNESRHLGKWLLEMHLSGQAEIHSSPSRFCSHLSDRPVASRLAQIQSRSGNRVTNRRHEPVVLGDLARQKLPELDGSRDRAALSSAGLDGVLNEVLRAALITR